jgi:predicted nucleic acid-binding protein
LIEADEQIALPGIVLQEILSGIRERAQFERLEEVLAGFPVILATQKTHVEAAQISNRCRSKGIAISAVDCLIAAMAIEHNAQLLTSDTDFDYMANHCALRLFARK